MQRFLDPCCDKCTYSKETPCDKFVECCLRGPLCHDDDSCKAARKAVIKRLAHNPKFLEQ